MIAIIPARGGSKGIPDKNIKKLCGKPLIAYTIEAAMQSSFINHIILSTDNNIIASVGKKYGAEVPFIRPQNLATDDASAIDVYIYTIERLNKEFQYNISEFVVLLPTSPLRTYQDIDQAINIFISQKADSVISFYEAPHPPVWAKLIGKDGKLSNYFNIEINNLNRQLVPKAYMPNGSIYVLKLGLLKEKNSYYSDKTFAYVMPPERSIDIDTQLEFDLTELYIKYKLHGTQSKSSKN